MNVIINLILGITLLIIAILDPIVRGFSYMALIASFISGANILFFIIEFPERLNKKEVKNNGRRK